MFNVESLNHIINYKLKYDLCMGAPRYGIFSCVFMATLFPGVNNNNNNNTAS